MAIPSASIENIRTLYQWWMDTSSKVSIHKGAGCETREEFETICERLEPLASWVAEIIGEASASDAKLWPDRLIQAAVLGVDLEVAAQELMNELGELCTDEDDASPAIHKRSHIFFQLGYMDQQLATFAHRTLILLRKFVILTAGY